MKTKDLINQLFEFQDDDIDSPGTRLGKSSRAKTGIIGVNVKGALTGRPRQGYKVYAMAIGVAKNFTKHDIADNAAKLLDVPEDTLDGGVDTETHGDNVSFVVSLKTPVSNLEWVKGHDQWRAHVSLSSEEVLQRMGGPPKNPPFNLDLDV